MFDLSAVVPHLAPLAAGAGVTAALSLVALLAGMPAGLALCALRASGRPGRWFVAAYVSLLRGTPLLVQLLVLFYVPAAAGLPLPPPGAAVLALALNTAAFQSEIYRAGFRALPRGQDEAARALGLRRWPRLRLVLLPQVLRLVLPALTNEAVDLLKGSALVSVIAVTELLRVGQQITALTYRPLETYMAVAVFYWLLTAALSLAGRALERRLSRGRAGPRRGRAVAPSPAAADPVRP